MSRIAILKTDEAGTLPPPIARGEARGRLLQPGGYPLWACAWQLADGAELAWDGSRGEEAVYVASGELEVAGRGCPSDGAVIIESGVETRLRARGACELIHFGSTDSSPPLGGRYGPPKADGHDVHVVGPGGRFRSGSRAGSYARWYADSTCPTCRICLIQVEREVARAGPPHHHSQDEIIYLVAGEIALGAEWHGPGTALFIPAKARYAIRTRATGYRFLNYRRDLSEQVYDPTDPPQLESALERGGVEVGDLR